MGQHREMNLLDPAFKVKAEKLIQQLNGHQVWKDNGFSVMVVETRRDLAVQMAYYARGRGPAQLVKDLFKAAGLWAITDAETATKSTNTLASKHLAGLAIDIVPTMDGRVPIWNAPLDVWLAVGQVAVGLGLTWGGTFESPDRPHVEAR